MHRMNKNISKRINKKMNKKAISPVIVFLVLLTLVLTVLTLIYINLKKEDIRQEMLMPVVIDEVYTEESLFDYYLQDLFDRAVGDMKEANVDVFFNNYNQELSRYKQEGLYVIENLEYAEISKSDVSIEIKEGFQNLVLKKSFVIVQNQVKNGKKIVQVEYDYNKNFEKVFK